MKIEFETNNFWYLIPTIVIGKQYKEDNFRYGVRITWLKWFIGIVWGSDL